MQSMSKPTQYWDEGAADNLCPMPQHFTNDTIHIYALTSCNEEMWSNLEACFIGYGVLPNSQLLDVL